MPLSGMCATRGCGILACHAGTILTDPIICTILPLALITARRFLLLPDAQLAQNAMLAPPTEGSCIAAQYSFNLRLPTVQGFF